MNNVFVLEMNEINSEILQSLVARGKLPNLERLLRTHHVVETRASEDYHKLEPWIQWVTVHTGASQSAHKAFNLTDGQHLRLTQIWDALEAEGTVCGVVSPMNGRRGRITQGFYIPDPWSATDDAYPDSLKPIYKFLSERVNSHNASLDRGSSKARFFIESLRAGVSISTIFRLAGLYVRSKLDKRTKWKLAAEFDRYLVDLTLALSARFKPGYTSVFLNGVAHYQHHYWSRHNRRYWAAKYPALFAKNNPLEAQNLKDNDDPIEYGLRAYDKILGRVQANFPDSSIVVVTGLGQVPFEGYEGDRGFYLYRAYDHEALFRALGIIYERIVPLMSRDVMIYLSGAANFRAAIKILENVHVNGERLFTWTEEDDNRLFVKVAFTFETDASTKISVPGLSEGFKFQEWFQFITFKTGHHCPTGLLIAPKANAQYLKVKDGILPLENVHEFLRTVAEMNHSSPPAVETKVQSGLSAT